MIDRRNFVRGGALAAGAIAAGVGFRAVHSAATSSLPVPLYTVVFDDRFAPSVDFGAAAARLSRRTRGLQGGDVTWLWYHDFYHRWKQSPAAIAGMTTPQTLFVLETLGRDVGLRRAFLAEHRFFSDRVQHTLEGPDLWVRSAALSKSGAGWSERMAHLVAACPASRVSGSRFECDSRLVAQTPGQPMLVSWVLAPIARRS